MAKGGASMGKWNGYGGKVNYGESVKAAAVREIKEESALMVNEKDLRQVAFVRFYFENVLRFECHVFFAKTWRGEPRETKEMRSHRWFQTSELPKRMWLGDKKWLPLILQKRVIRAAVHYNEDGSKLKKFKCKSAVF